MQTGNRFKPQKSSEQVDLEEVCMSKTCLDLRRWWRSKIYLMQIVTGTLASILVASKCSSSLGVVIRILAWSCLITIAN